MSPFLFILATEGVIGLSRNARSSTYFTSSSLKENFYLYFVQYADDTIIMQNVCCENIWAIKYVLRGFELISGLCVNLNKSKILGINTSPDFLQTTLNFLSCEISSLPFSYLGIPISSNPCRCATWNPIMTRIRNKMNVWKGKIISLVG